MTSALQELAMWRRVHVADVCETVSVGIVIQPSQYYVAPSQGIRAFRSANVGENRIVDRDWVYLSPEGHRANSKSSLRAGDVLVVRSGAPGTACVVTEEYAGSNCIDIVFARPHQDQVLPEYLAELTNSPVGRRHVLGTQGGLALKHFNVGAYKQLELLLPEIAEQKKIVKLFAAWETAIQKTEQLIAAKERHYSHELSRLISRGQHPHVHVGTFAEEVSARNRGGKWRTVPLSDIATVWKGQQLNKDAMVEDGAYYALNGGIKPSGRTTEWNCEADTITVSEGGNSCGFVSCNRERFWCGGHCYALTKLMHDVDAHYLFHYLKGKQSRVMALRVGSGLPNIQKSDIEAFPVVLPDLVTQTAIARYLNTLREEIDLLGQTVAALKTQKRGLMQKLLTGQWRLTQNTEGDTP